MGSIELVEQEQCLLHSDLSLNFSISIFLVSRIELEYDAVVPAILTLGQPIKIKTKIPPKHKILHVIAIKEAPIGFILNFLTTNPPVTIPKIAPGIATPPIIENRLKMC